MPAANPGEEPVRRVRLVGGTTVVGHEDSMTRMVG
jgi:hypothetical protein